MTKLDEIKKEMTEDETDFMTQFASVLEAGQKLKGLMLEKYLTKARMKCPICKSKGYSEHFLHGVLLKNRRDSSGFHLHMSCDGPCHSVYME